MRSQPAKRWMKVALGAASVYNLLWGAAAVLFPFAFFAWAGMAPPNYPELWQCLGMVIGVYGVGYAVAALDPYRHWVIVLVGLLGKLLGPLGFLHAYRQGRLPLSFGALLVTNDLIWWLPFGAILYCAHDAFSAGRRHAVPDVLRLALRARTQHGDSLESLSVSAPLLVVFLRHAGCPFCREALADLARERRQLSRSGVKLAFVHMGNPQQGCDLLARYSLDDLPRVSDPRQHLYRAFGLARGGVAGLFGPRIWWRGIQAMVLERHGVGLIVGDSFQMPGVFLLYRGEVIRSFRHQTVADRPDYVAIAHGEPFNERTAH